MTTLKLFGNDSKCLRIFRDRFRLIKETFGLFREISPRQTPRRIGFLLPWLTLHCCWRWPREGETDPRNLHKFFWSILLLWKIPLALRMNLSKNLRCFLSNSQPFPQSKVNPQRRLMVCKSSLNHPENVNLALQLESNVSVAAESRSA